MTTTRDDLRDGGMVCYTPTFYPGEQADAIAAFLGERIPWEHQIYYGKPSRRGTAWFADSGIEYRYSGQLHIGTGWDPFVDEIRREAERATQALYNSVLLNDYPDGKAQMGWHSDAEPELGQNPVIASLSFGAPRAFKLRHNGTGEAREYLLGHGSLLLMAGTLQHFWKHCLPVTSRPVGRRFNLTFRFTRPPMEEK